MSEPKKVYAVLMGGTWHIAKIAKAEAYGEHGLNVWSEQETTAWLGHVGSEIAVIDLSDAQVVNFLAQVGAEIIHARTKFPGDNLTTIAMFEEAGEVAKAVLDESPEAIRKECVQLACMAARIVLDGDSSTTKYRMERNGLGPIVERANG